MFPWTISRSATDGEKKTKMVQKICDTGNSLTMQWLSRLTTSTNTKWCNLWKRLLCWKWLKVISISFQCKLLSRHSADTKNDASFNITKLHASTYPCTHWIAVLYQVSSSVLTVWIWWVTRWLHSAQQIDRLDSGLQSQNFTKYTVTSHVSTNWQSQFITGINKKCRLTKALHALQICIQLLHSA